VSGKNCFLALKILISVACHIQSLYNLAPSPPPQKKNVFFSKKTSDFIKNAELKGYQSKTKTVNECCGSMTSSAAKVSFREKGQIFKA
jgi:hypothetical protein